MLQLAEPKTIQLRPYQLSAVERLREGMRAGLRRQILVAPTGAGKTEMAMEIVQASQRKGARAWFIVDRVNLIDQTSDRFSAYGIDHGVIQADHWMTDMAKPVQVASAQTLARRSMPNSPDLIIWDEAHCSYQSVIDLIARVEKAKVIGLTATPFTAGMAEHWDGLVNSTTVNRLLAEGYLAPLRIKACVSPDMKGAKKKFSGEFDEEDAGQRGLTIVGDVVQTWVEQTRKHFGGPVKTIVFSPSVKHGAELCRQFADAGYNFQQLSYLDAGDDERRAKISEFRRADSAIDGLVSCAVLTKGFDVPDVRCGISCRPYAKSFSSHIQEMGRVMRIAPGKSHGLWLCMARGSRVLTDKGLIPIEKITVQHKVWDGEHFVNHGGAVCNGIQPVITYSGLTATPGHLVHTAQGWRSFGDCAREQIPITQTGFGRRPIRIGEDHIARRSLARAAQQAVGSCRLRVRDLWVSIRHLSQQSAEGQNRGLPVLQSACAGIPDMAVSSGPGYAGAVQEFARCSVPQLWWVGGRIPLPWRQRRDALDNDEPRGSGELRGHGPRSGRPVRALRARQSPLAAAPAQSIEQAREPGCRQGPQISSGTPRGQVFRQYLERIFLGRYDLRGGRRAVPSTVRQAEREVWDILDAGPYNRFTCEGLLVHNCHSGNCVTFADDTAWLFEYGVESLSDAQKRDSEPREPKEKTKQKHFCGECGMQMEPASLSCSSCGWVRPQRGEIKIVEGELIDFDFEIGARFEPRKGLRAACLKDPRAIWNAALSYTSAHTSKGPEAARKWAIGIWVGIYEGAKPPRGFFDAKADPSRVEPDQWSLVDREVARFRKSSKRSAA